MGEPREEFTEEDEKQLLDACLPPYEGTGLPPELRALPQDELKVALRIGRALIVKKTRSKELAEELVPEVYLKVTKTRRWNAAKGPFGRHFVLCVKSELNHRLTSKKAERESQAREGFGREEMPAAAASPEDLAVRSEQESEDAAARQAKAAHELGELRARTSGHPLVPRVIDCVERGIEARSEIAAELGVPAQQVYRAIELIRHHVANIRKTGDPEKK